MSDFKSEPIIGLEVHVELKTKSKMFCPCKAEHFGAQPNTQTCPVCLGLPGALPFPNSEAIRKTILVGLALGCEINLLSKFDRKNYFYPDLPKGYQISQYDLPLARTGNWKLENGNVIRIRRVHLEEDTGKLVHTKENTLIDFNRAGVALMEIVTEPDFHLAETVKFFLQKLQQIIRYLGVAEADMEKGQMRCEPNVNLKITENGKDYFTPIVEIKNVNSFHFVQQAIDYEIKRQTEIFGKNGKTSGNKETRGWDEQKKETVLQREKEEAQDYRYFPEPDIPPIKLTQFQINELKAKIGETPEEKQVRFIKQYDLTEAQVQILTETREKADYFEEVVKLGAKTNLQAVKMANLIINKRLGTDQLTPEKFVQAATKQQKEPVMEKEKLVELIEQTIKENQRAVEDYKNGKTTALEFLVGQVSRLSQGKADANQTRELLLEALDAS